MYFPLYSTQRSLIRPRSYATPSDRLPIPVERIGKARTGRITLLSGKAWKFHLQWFEFSLFYFFHMPFVYVNGNPIPPGCLLGNAVFVTTCRHRLLTAYLDSHTFIYSLTCFVGKRQHLMDKCIIKHTTFSIIYPCKIGVRLMRW